MRSKYAENTIGCRGTAAVRSQDGHVGPSLQPAFVGTGLACPPTLFSEVCSTHGADTPHTKTPPGIRMNNCVPASLKAISWMSWAAV